MTAVAFMAFDLLMVLKVFCLVTAYFPWSKNTTNINILTLAFVTLMALIAAGAVIVEMDG